MSQPAKWRYAEAVQPAPIVRRGELPQRCFTPDQWEMWGLIARDSIVKPPAHGYCTDCTPAYKAKMIREGRCNYPEVKFLVDHDGMIEGVR